MHQFVACALAAFFVIACAPVVAAESLPASNFLNAKEAFGLVGDGKADDTEGIQAMFHAQRPVFLPNGTYRITKTITGKSTTQIHGGGGNSNPKGQSTILYDGPEGGIVLSIASCRFFSMRYLTVNGNGKANVGVYWMHTTSQSLMEDCSIIRTRKHGLFITKTWYAHFNRVTVVNNEDRGITLDRGEEGATSDPDLAKGPVNYVTFFECKANGNGRNTDYNGDTIIDTGYGFGSFGCNSVINLIACVLEGNGGPGAYLSGHPVNFTFAGCYFENNSRAVRRIYKGYKDALGDDWLTHKDRGPLGRIAHIIEDTTWQWSVVFDNCYCHGSAGVWLRGQGNNNPIEFRNLVRPIAIWSEHSNWVMINCSEALLTGRPGIERMDKDRIRTFFDPVSGPSGHPGYVMLNGVTRVWPHSTDGLALFVNTDSGNNRHDGRTPETAWKSLTKATGLFSNTTLDTPVTITVAGTTATTLDLHNVSGMGTITILCESALTLDEATAANISCGLVLQGDSNLVVTRLRLLRCPDVEITGALFRASDSEGALICEGNSGVVLKRCEAVSSAKNAVVVAALRNSVVSVVNPEMPTWRVQTEDGGQINLTRPNVD